MPIENDLLKPPTRPHKVIIESKERAIVTGVEDVDSFNENEVIFLTSMGMMTILGQDLHISKLNLEDGQLVIDGVIDCADYSVHDALRHKNGFFKFILGACRLTATINQPYIFLATIYGGLLIGLLYGAISAIRHLTHAGRTATILWDILFFAGGTLISLAVIYIASKANLRMYTFLGLGCGFFMYYFGLRATIAHLYQKYSRKKKVER